jgi:hypothetical protein
VEDEEADMKSKSGMYVLQAFLLLYIGFTAAILLRGGCGCEGGGRGGSEELVRYVYMERESSSKACSKCGC